MASPLADAIDAAASALRESPTEVALALAAVVLTALALMRLLGGGGAATAVATPAVAPPPRKLTRADVSAHTSPTDAWIIIGKGVYNITSYVEEHPGGVAAILRNAGGDSTAGFHGPQHPARVFDMIEDFRIGDLVDV